MMFPTLLITIPDFSSPTVWISLITLTFLEIVLGVDNVIFISIVANRLPEKQRKDGRNIGLSLALLFRIGMLLGITWLIGLTKPLFLTPAIFGLESIGISAKDLILILGGIFLLYKSTAEIHHKLEGDDQDEVTLAARGTAFAAVIAQIVLVDIVFSFDSILTAIGMSNEVLIMIIAVVISIGLMMRFSGAISKFINTHPTMQMLALSFLILIGMMLLAEGFHQHVSKGYIYFAIAFSLIVELINLRFRKKQRKKAIKLSNLHDEGVREGII